MINFKFFDEWLLLKHNIRNLFINQRLTRFSSFVGLIFLFIEIESDVEIQISKNGIRGELLFAVIVGVENCTCTDIPLGVVPYKSEAPYPIHVKVSEGKVVGCYFFSSDVAVRVFIAQRKRQRGSKHPVVCKDPVVSISSG